jgi:hypothetical protein
VGLEVEMTWNVAPPPMPAFIGTTTGWLGMGCMASVENPAGRGYGCRCMKLTAASAMRLTCLWHQIPIGLVGGDMKYDAVCGGGELELGKVAGVEPRWRPCELRLEE